MLDLTKTYRRAIAHNPLLNETMITNTFHFGFQLAKLHSWQAHPMMGEYFTAVLTAGDDVSRNILDPLPLLYSHACKQNKLYLLKSCVDAHICRNAIIMVVIYSVFVINRAGGLIYSQTIRPSANPAAASLNDQLRLASTFHGLSTIASELVIFGDTDGPKSGIHTLCTEGVVLKAMKTLTGLTFVIVASAETQTVIDFLPRMYQMYTDFALKNPFYELDMPVKCSQFDYHLKKLITAAITSSS